MAYGTPGNDTVRLTSPTAGETVDLGEGTDGLVLADGGNDLRTIGVERLTAGSGDDTVRFDFPRTPIDRVPVPLFVDLRAGTDRLVYTYNPVYGPVSDGEGGFEPVSNPVLLTVRGVEVVEGGTPRDSDTYIRIGERANGTDVTMRGLADHLELSGSANGPANLVTVRGVEFVAGSAARDVVRMDAWTGSQFNRVDLGEGSDRLELVGNGPHKVAVSGVEAILGGAGADDIELGGGVAGSVSIDLGGGNDTVRASYGIFSHELLLSNVEGVFLGGGDDTVTLRTAHTTGTIDLGGGFDTLRLAAPGNTVTVFGVENVIGSSGTDRIYTYSGTSFGVDAGGGNDIVVGYSGDDTLIGGAGEDRLSGGAGNDVLVGGAGKDVMTGGAGADRFVFDAVSDSDTATRDIVEDFETGVDRIVFGAGPGSGDFFLVGEAAFSASGRTELRFFDATDQLLVDLDGDGALDMRMTLRGVDGPSLSASDFVWGAA